MAKFKKKKSRPTPDPVDPKKEPVKEAEEGEKKDAEQAGQPAGPETELEKAARPGMPPEPAAAHAEKNENSRKLNRLFWLRVALAVAAGTAATFVFEGMEGEERRWASIAFMIIVFLVTIFIAKGMRMQLPSSDRKKIVTQGIGSYTFIYLFIWIVSYTLVNMGSAPAGITSPIP